MILFVSLSIKGNKTNVPNHNQKMNDVSKLRSIKDETSSTSTSTSTSTSSNSTTTNIGALNLSTPEEDEPQLKYQRLGGSVSEILKRDVASCLVVHPRFLTLGTHSGMLFVLDFEGNEIKRFSKHTVTINAISVEPSGEYIATAVSVYRFFFSVPFLKNLF